MLEEEQQLRIQNGDTKLQEQLNKQFIIIKGEPQFFYGEPFEEGLLIEPTSAHTENNTFPNEDSEKTFSHQSEDNKPFSCDICTFPRKTNLIAHYRIHTGEKPYSCDVCNKKFACGDYLVKHKRTHTGEKPFSCDICKKAFTCRNNLTVHLRVHTGEKPYSCDDCDKTFTVNQQLVLHKKMHSENKS
ncbi:putative zinc finger protein 702 [Chrysoperla carnea]|uniref:putative zinc finger protein 702 n=1 Tax=Chrysoperla carnea TaxID=189513 RepID=UPI001D09692C|nr:putative zinc finger protein 702 [Chrysoperla carnea]